MKVLGAVPVKQFFYDDLAELTMPFNLLLQPENDEVEVPSDPRFQMAKHMNAFIKRAAQVNCSLRRKAWRSALMRACSL